MNIPVTKSWSRRIGVSRLPNPLLHHSITPSPQLESSETHTQAVAFGYFYGAFFDREAKEWVSGNNLKFSELTQRRDPRHARGKMHRGSIAHHATGGIGERAAYAGLFAQLGNFPYFLDASDLLNTGVDRIHHALFDQVGGIGYGA